MTKEWKLVLSGKIWQPLCRGHLTVWLCWSWRSISSLQEVITVRVQDPRVQNEGSWNSYVDYKIFLHVSASNFDTGVSTLQGWGPVLRQNLFMDVLTEVKEGGEEREPGVCLRVVFRLPGGILLCLEPSIRTVAWWLGSLVRVTMGSSRELGLFPLKPFHVLPPVDQQQGFYC